MLDFTRINETYENAGIKKNTALIEELKKEINEDFENGKIEKDNYEALMKNIY